MNELERYLAEEIALDHADGLVPRREALRRLALLGVGAAAASTLLTACGKDRPAAGPVPSAAPAASAPPARERASAPGMPALPTEEITLPGPEGRTLRAAWAKADAPRGAVLVVHENKGLNDHIRSIAGRLARERYAALAIDLLSEEGGTAALGEPANATAALAKVSPTRFVADMVAALDELSRRAPGVPLGAIGFCFGGAMTWRLVAAKDPRLAAAAPFYGPLPEGADLAGAKTAVLAVYAEKDARVNASRDAAKAALEKAALTHRVETFAGADHAFFNDTGPRYAPDAAAKAWAAVLAWFGDHLAGTR